MKKGKKLHGGDGKNGMGGGKWLWGGNDQTPINHCKWHFN